MLLALLSTTVFNYILSFVAMALFLFFYAKPDGCLINKFFITVNMILCMAASIVSVLQKVQVDIASKKVQLYCVMCSDMMCFAGVSATLRPATVLHHHPLHHVPYLVCHEQRAR